MATVGESRVDVKQAVRSAVEFAGQLPSDLTMPRLEEVELSEDGSIWMITLSFDRAASSLGGIAASLVNRTRDYKVFAVRADTGEVTSMKIRTGL